MMQESQNTEFKRQWKDDWLKWISPFSNAQGGVLMLGCDDDGAPIDRAKLMTKHASRPFNPDIASTFFRAGLIEAWGRGIERIIEACRQENYPAPQWQVEPGGLWVVFGLEAASEGKDAGVNVGVNVGVSDAEKELLAFIEKHQPINAAAIAAHYPQVIQRTVERWLKSLREQGLVEFRGAPKTGGYYVLSSEKQPLSDSK